MKRKKRLKKGIESIKEQIAIHKSKLEEAREEGNEELARYYEKEIPNLEKEEQRKEGLLEKQ